MVEIVVELTVRNKATRAGFFARKLAWPGRRAAPDHMFAHPERGIVFIEFKRPGEKPTAAQCREHKRMRDAGMEVHWFDNVNEALACLGIL